MPTRTQPITRSDLHDELILATFEQLTRRRDRSLIAVDNEDALQQCVLRLIEQIDVLAERYPTPTLLAAALWASAAPEFRRTERIQRAQGAQLVDSPSDSSKQPKRRVVSLSERDVATDPRRRGTAWFATDETGYSTVELRYEFIELLRLLPPRIRQLLWLVRVEGQDVTDAATALGWSRCHASRQLNKAEARLRRIATRWAASGHSCRSHPVDVRRTRPATSGPRHHTSHIDPCRASVRWTERRTQMTPQPSLETVLPRHTEHPDTATGGHPSGLGPVANFPRCPVCGSYEVSRHTEMGRVWFSCRRCGLTF